MPKDITLIEATARLKGPGTLVALDMKPRRLKLAEELGADLAIDVSEGNAIQRILERGSMAAPAVAGLFDEIPAIVRAAQENAEFSPPAPAPATSPTIYIYEGVQLLECYDGDTCTYDVPRSDPILGLFVHKQIKVRVINIDTPEMQRVACPAEKDLAIRARDRMVQLQEDALRVDLYATGNDTYSRVLAFIVVDGLDAGEILIAEGLARPWAGRRESWC